MGLWIKETFVNETKGYHYGHADWYETYHDTIKDLFRSLQSEYGKASSMYRDKSDGKAIRIGWVFTKRVEYDDAHRISRKEDKTYERSVWVEVSDVEPKTKVVYQQFPHSPLA